MVKLHIKKGDESQFLFETVLDESVDDTTSAISVIYNGRLKVSRICMEMEELAKHGTMLPANMMGLTDEQVQELKLVDEWEDKCIPSGGWTFNRDEIGRRNGHQPNDKMQQVLLKTIEEAKAMLSKKQVQADVCINIKMVQQALDILRGATMIVYPMNLPPHDVIRQEFENTEDLAGTQASLEVIDGALAQMWFSGKEMLRGKKLSDYLGRNEKTKVIIKLAKVGHGPPGREPVVSEDERKQMMLHAYRRQEELKDSAMAEGKEKEPTAAEKLLFYTTAFFVLLGTFSLFAFLFLVPFVIEPAFTTILMEFSEVPATCLTTSVESMQGASNCTWTSCKEGCTKEVYECMQIRVNYKINVTEEEAAAQRRLERQERAIREYHYADETTYEESTILDLEAPEEPSPTGLMGNNSEWYYVGAKFFPNVKGCGYPPMLNCSIFYKKYKTIGTNYSCYYSRMDPGLVISDLDMWQVYMNLVFAMAIPIPSFIVSVIYLTIAYFYIYNEETETPRRPPRRRDGNVEVTPLPISTPVPPPTSGALTPASEIFREDLASFGHQLKVAMADDMSRESIIPDSVPFVNSNSMNGNLNKMMTTSILTPPGPIAEV